MSYIFNIVFCNIKCISRQKICRMHKKNKIQKENEKEKTFTACVGGVPLVQSGPALKQACVLWKSIRVPNLKEVFVSKCDYVLESIWTYIGCLLYIIQENEIQYEYFENINFCQHSDKLC